MIPVNARENVKASFTLNKDLVASDKSLLAPIKKGQKVGLITFSLDGKPIYQLPLTALSDVEEAGFDCAVTTVYGKAYPGMDPMLLPRIRMNNDQTIEQFISMVAPPETEEY